MPVHINQSTDRLNRRIHQASNTEDHLVVWITPRLSVMMLVWVWGSLARSLARSPRLDLVRRDTNELKCSAVFLISKQQQQTQKTLAFGFRPIKVHAWPPRTIPKSDRNLFCGQTLVKS
jgi:hypothetical protein